MSQQIGSKNENQIPVSHPRTSAILRAMLNTPILNDASLSEFNANSIFKLHLSFVLTKITYSMHSLPHFTKN